MAERPTAGARSCATCLLHHPERPKRPCSCFVQCVATDNCAAYIGDKKTEVHTNEKA